MSDSKHVMFDDVNTRAAIESLLVKLRIATVGYPSSEAQYPSVRAYLEATSTQSWQTKGAPIASYVR